MKNKVIFKYVVYGALFGCVFPIVATLLRIYELGLSITWGSVWLAQSSDPLQWIIDTAPFFLGMFAGLGGLRQARVLELNQHLDQKVKELTRTSQELRLLQAELELRISERTRALEASIEVSRRLSMVLDIDQLVSEVVEQVKATFGYYHVHIYLFDDWRESLAMVGGTGEAGQIMLERGHKIPKGKGVVGRVAETNAPLLVADVRQSQDWLPNSLLPETRAEAAVPIAIGQRVLGVLDVQHNIVSGLKLGDVDLLQAVASQVAIAIQNAKTFTQLQQRAEREALVNIIGQRIQATNGLDELLQLAVRDLGQTLGARRASVELSGQNRYGG